jgi:hypothetical protein
MLYKRMKIAARLIVVFLLGMIVSTSLVYSHLSINRVPNAREFKQLDSLTNAYPVASKTAIKRSIRSSVRIIALDVDSGRVSVSSGTYFKHDDLFYVLTVKHGIDHLECDFIKIEADGSLYSCDQIVSYDVHTDYVLMSVQEIVERKAINFPKDFVSKFREWKQTVSPLEPLIYTGFPNTIGPVTLSGRVMGMSPDEYVYFNSYAWSGSSGSGVFNSKGKFMGYIVAIDVGRTEHGMDVLENVILVVPHYRVDWSVLLNKGK